MVQPALFAPAIAPAIIPAIAPVMTLLQSIERNLDMVSANRSFLFRLFYSFQLLNSARAGGESIPFETPLGSGGEDPNTSGVEPVTFLNLVHF